MLDLAQQRSMLMILIAARQTAQTAFESADNPPVDPELLTDLSKMIEPAEAELAKVSQMFKA